MKEELLKGLTEEQIAKVKACKNAEEILAYAKEEDIVLTDEQLEAVSGGCGTSTTSKLNKCGLLCPKCHEYKYLCSNFNGQFFRHYCTNCNISFTDAEALRR